MLLVVIFLILLTAGQMILIRRLQRERDYHKDWADHLRMKFRYEISSRYGKDYP